jgi:DNA-binding NarL/FixJ family response regulator
MDVIARLWLLDVFPSKPMPISVSIVEDNDKLRGTLAKVIGRAEGFRCASDYGSAEDALAGLPKIKPDVVLMDINLPGMNGVECVRQLKAQLPATQVMMLTVYEDTENIFNALAAGASGYMLKRTPARELLDAIREVHRGGSPMTTHIARKVVQSFLKPVSSTAAAPAPTNELSELSEREQQVLDLLAQGLIYKEIADKLQISYETVHTYIRRIYEKLQVRTRTEAVAKFLQR